MTGCGGGKGGSGEGGVPRARRGRGKGANDDADGGGGMTQGIQHTGRHFNLTSMCVDDGVSVVGMETSVSRRKLSSGRRTGRYQGRYGGGAVENAERRWEQPWCGGNDADEV